MSASSLVCAENCSGGELHNSGGMAWLAMIPLDFVYIWKEQQICPEELKTSLQQILSVYPAVAGRVMDCNRLSVTDEGHTVCRVACNNKGVGFEVVKVLGSARDIAGMENGPKRGTYTNFPSISQVISGVAPLLTVKLTIFEDGGCALGLVANHIVFDGWTFAMFMKDWSLVHSGKQIEPTISSTLPATLRIPSADEVQSIAKSKGLKSAARGLMGKLVFKVMYPLMFRFLTKSPLKRSILHFTDQELAVLKTRAQTKAGTWISTNEALLAHLHPLMLDACGVPKECWDCVGASFAVNLRAKLSGLSSRAIGNNVCGFNLSYDLKDPEHGAARMIHEVMRKELTESELCRSIELMNYQMTHHELFMPMNDKLKPGALGFIHQWNYQATSPYYEVNFGVGRPDRGLPWSYEAVKVMRGPDGGLDVMVHQGKGMGMYDWIRNPYHYLASGLNVAAVAILGWSWFKRKSSTKSVSIARIGLITLLLSMRHTISRAHARRVQACFAALENHPKLRSFMKEAAVFGA